MTLFLYLLAAIDALVAADEEENASALFNRYVVTSTKPKGKSNLTLHPCMEDQGDMNAVVQSVLEHRKFGTRNGLTFHPLPDTTLKNGRVNKNFRRAKRYFANQYQDGGLERVNEVYGSLLQRISVVQIDVQDPTNGPRIFNSLNSRHNR